MHLQKEYIDTKIAVGSNLESVSCYLCGSSTSRHFCYAQDDLTGRPGKFKFVTCSECNLTYQNPRVPVSEIGAFYDEEYIAHRKKKNWGLFSGMYEKAMDKHDSAKMEIVSKYVSLSAESTVLDVGCAVGSFLGKLKKIHNLRALGIDFKDLRAEVESRGAEFFLGSLAELYLPPKSCDLVTMWHFLEHDYSPMESLKKCLGLLKEDGRIIIEVPRLDS